MNLSKYNKTFDMRRRNQSRSNQNRLELPNINKTIDLATSNTYSKTSQLKYPTFIQQFQWVLIDKNYNYMNEPQIYKEYQLLRKQIFHLNDLVVKELERFHRKASRKRIITYTEPEKINEVREKQIQNNTFVLGMMSKEYKGLKVKSQTMQPKQAIQQQIQQVKQQISGTKQKITSLKLKNKAIGDSIINTDQVLAQMKQCQREYQVWNKKRRQLQVKLDKVNTESQKVIQNLDKITMDSTSAQDYFKTKEKGKKQQMQKNVHLESYNQKLHSLQVIKKNNQIFSGLKQQKYHQLLKQLQAHIEKDEKMNLRTQQIEYSLIEFTDQVQTLQKKLKNIKNEHSALGFYQSSHLDHSPERSIDSEQSLSNQNMKPNPRLSMFIQKDKNIVRQNISGNKFTKNQLPATAHEKGYDKNRHDKTLNPKINSGKTSQFKLNQSQIAPKNTTDKVQTKSQLPKSTQFGKMSQKVISNTKIKEQRVINPHQVHQNIENVYSQQINVQEQKIIEMQTQIMHQKDSIKQFQQQKSLVKKSSKKPFNFDQLRETLQEHPMTQQLKNNSKQQKQYKQLSGEIRQMMNNKVEKEQKAINFQETITIDLQEKVTIDLQKIQQNIEKVSRSRMRVKEQLTSNFNKYITAQQQANKSSETKINTLI